MSIITARGRFLARRQTNNHSSKYNNGSRRASKPITARGRSLARMEVRSNG